MGSASLDPQNLTLRVSTPTNTTPMEISTVYFRAGYAPTDYPTPAHFAMRFALERSKAINCPSIPLQLAGGKKVQEVLTQPGVLERFLPAGETNGVSKEQLAELRSSWMSMWGLDISEDLVTPDSRTGEVGFEPFGVRKSRELAQSLVLKPQREGGGNNVYKESIPSFLDTLPPHEREAWIAMELIATPKGAGNYLLRSGGATGGITVKTEVISELGIFGWALFGAPDGRITEQESGWLVRTKGKDSNEGGVATGFSVLDSLILLDD